MKKVLSFRMIGALALPIAFFAFAFTVANPGYKVGDKAIDFKLKNTAGKEVSLASIEGAKGYIVVFTCNACPYAKAYEDRVIALHNKYAPLGYPVVAINANDKDVQPADSYDKMKERVREKNIPYQYVYDETQEIAKTYGATRTPHVYVLDQNRVVRYIGAIDDNSEEPDQVKEKYVEKAVDALRSNQDVLVKETKAVGCGIKWKKA